MATEDDKKDETTEESASASDATSSSDTEAAAEKVAVKDAEPAKTEAHGGEGEEEILIAEPDRVNVGMIGAITLAIVIATVATVIGVQQFFTQTMQGEVSQKVYEQEDPTRKDLALVEQAKLSKYQWVNQKDGLVRIPKDRARELVLAEYGKMPPYQPGAMPAPSAPPVEEPGPAPSTSAEPSTSASVAPSASVPGIPSGTPAPSGSVAPGASTLKPGMAPSTSASVPHKH